VCAAGVLYIQLYEIVRIDNAIKNMTVKVYTFQTFNRVSTIRMYVIMELGNCTPANGRYMCFNLIRKGRCYYGVLRVPQCDC